MRTCQLSKSQLQERRTEALRTGMNRASRRRSSKTGVKSLAEVKKEESQKQA